MTTGKMATTVVEFGVSPEKVTFSGSSDEDMMHAKMFWQSMHLCPPMESTLVSSDISQRLRVAPTAHQGVSRHPRISEDTPKLKAFLAKAQSGDNEELSQKQKRHTAFRQMDLALLHKHRQQRMEKEKISASQRLCSGPAEKAAPPKEAEVEEAAESRQQIDLFEEQRGLRSEAE